ncbi:hypothetical protein H6G33_36285 [Calothrix sp. FACHB-1219]|uniref:hypothetical protein n=1 Tax=unclassified Calothrix TaxID=2619626 RepID=UPI0016884299|nr:MULTISPECIES: hypothetical protein [unclassified Calothrix]MBD2207771.1 hypothetical protein [Calothrix sp. FACHB-168]MBD2222391.1 hypothetical protein [Calothrix sp. FACHB-1219]
MINQLPATNSRDLTTVQRCLLEAELLLTEANTLAQNLKKSNPNLDEFASNVADSLHYCTEVLNKIEG